jgi:hypothetical protein
MVTGYAVELVDGEVKDGFIITKLYMDLVHPVRCASDSVCKRSSERLSKNEKSEAMNAIGHPRHSSGTSHKSGMRFQPSDGLPRGRPD